VTRPPSAPDRAGVPRASWRDYYEIGKPKVVLLIVFTAVVGMFLAAPSWPPLDALVFGTLGIGSPHRAQLRSITSSTVVTTRRWRARCTVPIRRDT
jgi:hypothetical protein